MSGLNMLDLFSGIGGFHEGFKRAGYQFDWVGFSEIDKYASAVYKYNYKESEELGDITTIQPGRDTPDNIDILCGGFPCQAFSVAGKRLGFDDTRGTLFFEIARILRHYREVGKPISCFLLENVKGLLSHDNGRTFATIYRVLNNLGYTIEFQLLNTRWWLPQNRERIYIVGYIGNRGGPQVFPIGEPSEISDNRNAKVASTLQHPGHSGGNYKGMTMIDVVGNTKSGQLRSRIYSEKGIAPSLSGTDYKQPKQIKLIETFTERSFDGKREDGGRALRKHKVLGETPCLSAMMGMGGNNVPMMKVPEATKKGYAEAEIGDSINFERLTSKTRRGRVTKGYAQSLETVQHQHTIQPVLTPNRAEKRQNGRRFKEDGEDMFTLTQQDQHGVMIKSIRSAGNKDGSRYYYEDDVSQTIAANPTSDNLPMVNSQAIRRLTPVECMRLQGFADNHNQYGIIDDKVVEISDTQRYKQAGNAVTVDVVQAVATIIKEKELL